MVFLKAPANWMILASLRIDHMDLGRSVGQDHLRDWQHFFIQSLSKNNSRISNQIF